MMSTTALDLDKNLTPKASFFALILNPRTSLAISKDYIYLFVRQCQIEKYAPWEYSHLIISICKVDIHTTTTLHQNLLYNTRKNSLKEKKLIIINSQKEEEKQHTAVLINIDILECSTHTSENILIYHIYRHQKLLHPFRIYRLH